MDTISKGICKCGCGQKTRISTRNHKARGWIKNEPLDFVHGHNGIGEMNGHYKGGRFVNKDGYALIYLPEHHRAGQNGYVFEHIVVVENHLKITVEKGTVIHHKDRNPSNNSIDNLELVENQVAHMDIHAKERALLECGNADWRKCCFCHNYDAVENLRRMTSRGHYHSECRKIYRRTHDSMAKN